MKKSCVHVYTGDGKGKSTCAFGLAIRCAGNGFKVKIIQFLKTDATGEVAFLENVQRFDIQVYRFEEPHGFTNEMSDEQLAKLKEQTDTAMRFAKLVLESGECDMLVLDEIICSYSCGLVSEEKIRELIESRNQTELVLTGRCAPQWLIDVSDYVTQMECKKHPYDKNICARKGIEF